MEQDSPNKSMIKAIIKGDCESVKLLLEKGANVTYGGHWCSTLAVASSWGHQKIVQLLLDKGAVVNHSDYGYCWALTLASLGGHKSIVQLLLKNGAIGNPKEPPHEAALLKGHKEIAKLLLKNKGDIKQGSKGGNTGLTLD